MTLTLDNEATITGAPSQLKEQIQEYFTLDNPRYQEARKYGRYTKGIKKTLCFCHGKEDIRFPKGAAERIYRMAMAYGAVEVEDKRIALKPVHFTFHGTLRPYQSQGIDQIMERNTGVFQADTGAGKTMIGLAAIAEREQPTLILVHTKELLYQWQDRIKTFLGIEAGLIGDGKHDVQPVTVGIVNSVKKHLSCLSEQFGHLIVDECHRVPSSLFLDVVEAFPCKYTLGLSATPYRRDGLSKLIGWTLGEHWVKVDPAHLRNLGAILKPRIIERETAFQYRYSDDYSTMITALIEDRGRNILIAADIEKQIKDGGLSLVVSDRIEHLHTLADMVGEGWILTGKTPQAQRRKIVGDLQSGICTVLYSTTSLIGEGFDCPAMEALFLASPIKFSGRLKQVVGRVLRPAEGKVPLVYDYQDMNVGVLVAQAKARMRVYEDMEARV